MDEVKSEKEHLGLHAEHEKSAAGTRGPSKGSLILVGSLVAGIIFAACFYVGPINAPKLEADTGATSPTAEEDSGEYFSTSTEPKSWRTFHFPRLPLGYLELPSGTQAFRYNGPTLQPERKPPAFGEVLIQHFAPFSLYINRPLGDGHVQLRHFRPDELCEIEFKKATGVVDPWLESISSLKSIKRLSIHSADALTDKCIESINKLPQLESFYMGRSSLTAQGILSLKRLSALTYFGLENFPDGKIVAAGLPLTLTNLEMRYCGLDRQSLQRISKMKNLTVLDISGNNLLADNDLKLLSSLPHLKELKIVDCGHFTVKGLKSLSVLPLKKLGFGNSQFSQNQEEQIKEIFPKCEINKLKPHESPILLLHKFILK